jgi:uncharacterized protein (DUF1499 family)
MILNVALGLILLLGAYFGYKSFSAQNSIPVFNGEVTRCEGKPNCISTAGPAEFQVAPWQLVGSFDNVKNILKSEATQVLVDQEYFLHIVIKSRFFRYPDDVVLKRVGDQVFFRSSSRVGYSDMGVNKKRMLQYESKLKLAGYII